MTNLWDLFSGPTKEISFKMHDHFGKIAVYYGANFDPVKAGFDLLGGLNFDPSLCEGYPVLHARIDDYTGSGYRSICGWMQIVTRLERDSHDPKIARSKASVSIDIAPAFSGCGLPFTCFGNLPQFFDAPCHNLNESAEVIWTADTFLTTTPLRSRGEAIERLASFRWGYIETDIPAERPEVLPLEVTGSEAWNSHLPFLMKEFPGWVFKPA